MDLAVKEILDQCYRSAVDVIENNREDMDKVVAYLLQKETITGAEMVAIIEGRDPELVEDAYASTQSQEGFRPSTPDVIEPAAKKVHMISQKIEAPEPQTEDTSDKPEEPSAPAEQPSAPAEQPQDSDSQPADAVFPESDESSLPSSPEYKIQRGMD